MLRKVVEVGEWEFPHSVVERHEDGLIVEIPETYTRVEPVLEDDIPVVEEVGTDDEGNPIYRQVMSSVEYVVDVEAIGEPATWADVRSPLYFDLEIDGKLYSWDNKVGSIHIGLDRDGSLGIVSYIRVTVNGGGRGHIKRVIGPKFTPIVLKDGMLTVNGVSTPNSEFVGALSGHICTLGDIIRVKGDIRVPLWFPPEGDGDDDIME